MMRRTAMRRHYGKSPSDGGPRVTCPMDSPAVPYRIRRSDRARHARIVVDADGVEVVVPRRMALRHVEPFVRQKRPWIERTLRRYQDAVIDGDVRIDLRDGGEVPYLGEQ